MSNEGRCKFEPHLNALLAGTLSPEAEEALTDHLRECRICRERLDDLSAQDTLLSGEARKYAADPPPQEHELLEMIQRLRSKKPWDKDATTEMSGADGPSSQSPSSDISLEFLTPSNSPQSLGKLGDYEIVGVIGSGGMGIVLKARDPGLERIVAIKVLKPELAANGAARRRFAGEAQKAAAVMHDHVVTIHAVGEANGLPYIVMEYIVGVSLDERIRRTGPLKVEEILRIGMQAASGLAAAHAQGLVHRDIKPANILLENGVERVKIADFGLARAMDDMRVTREGAIAGTPEYMSPEQVRDEPIDHRSDLFSLGCVLYAMCTGRSPFRATNLAAIVRRVCNDEPRPIRGVNSDIPEWLSEIVVGLLAKEPEGRPQSASEVELLLGQHLAHIQRPDETPMPRPVASESGHATGSRHRHLRWAVSATVLLLLGLFMLTEFTGVTRMSDLIADLIPTGVTGEPGGGTYPKPIVKAPDESRKGEDNDQSLPPKVGELQVHTWASTCQIYIKGIDQPTDRRVFETVTRKTRRTLTLPAGEYEVRVVDTTTNEDLRTDRIVIFPGQLHRIEVNSDRVPPVRKARTTLLGHGGNTKAQFFDNGRLILTASANGTVTARQREGSRWPTLWEIQAHPGEIHHMAASCEQLLAVAANDGSVSIWDATNHKRRRILAGHVAAVHEVEFSPDGRKLVTACSDGVAKLWDTATWKLLGQIDVNAGARPCVAFSPDGRTLAASGADGTVEIWDVDSRESMRSFHGHTRAVEWLTFSPDGRYLVSSASDSLTIVWDVVTAQPMQTISGVHRFYRPIAFSPDGENLAVADGDLISFWDWKSGELLDEFAAHWGTIFSVAFAPDGRSLISGSSDRSVKIWDVDLPGAGFPKPVSPQPITTFSLPSQHRIPRQFCFSRQRPNIMAVGAIGSQGVQVWDFKERRMEAIFEAHPPGGLWGMAFSPDGTLATGGRTEDGEGVIKFWVRDSWKLTKMTPCGPVPGPMRVASDGQRIAFLAWNRKPSQVCVWDAEADQMLFTVTTRSDDEEYGAHHTLSWSPDGSLLAVGTDLGLVGLWDGKTGELRATQFRHSDSTVWDVAFSPDGTVLASAGVDSRITLWDLNNVDAPEQLAILDDHEYSVMEVAFSPDGSLLVTAGGDHDASNVARLHHRAEIKVWDTATWRLLASFAGHEETVWGAQFSPDGKVLATSGRDNKVHLWDVGELLELGIVDEG